MSAALIAHDPAHASHPTPAEGHVVERTAFYFESEGRSLFAWLHRPADAALDHGVLICPPIGHEQVHSHRTLRHLADSLAARGFAVMRFDYLGTGDSEGTGGDAPRLATWRGNVRDAAGWLRGSGGCRLVSLVGVRVGATLAALHAADHGVEQLVLWEPVVKGRRYVRELRALSQTASQTGVAEESSLEAAGFLFPGETVGDLAEIDLTTVAPRFRRGLIVRSEAGAGDTVLLDHLAKVGTAIEQRSFPGYDGMMAEPHFTTMPEAALESIATWLFRNPPAAARGSLPVASVCTEMLTHGDVLLREGIHRISTSPDLFGITTEPDGRHTSLPWIVFLNAGAACRVGPGAIYVRLAREFASLGHPCLRMDISGLGDSRADAGRAENDTYPATAFRDVAVACDYLQALQPGRRIILLGLCSGAYAAFQSAAQLPHPAIIGGVLVNPLTFYWKEGMTLDESPTRRLQAWHYYRRILLEPESWRNLLTGKTNMGVKGAFRRIFQRLARRPGMASREEFAEGAPVAPGGFSHPAKDDLTGDLTRVVEASRRLVLIVSESDPGHFLLMRLARRKATRLIREGSLRCFFIRNADHTFSTESARQCLSECMANCLRGWIDATAGERDGPSAVPMAGPVALKRQMS